MPSADFCAPIGSPLGGPLPCGERTDLPGYDALSFLPSIRRIYLHRLRVRTGLLVFWPLRPGGQAFYALRVPRTGSLLTASSRPRLAAAALAVRL